ncbi:MAG: holin [Clostridia bacterium]|nr:holin [Clostridia bacterium]
MKQSGLRNPMAWTSVLAMIIYSMKTLGLLEPFGITEECLKEASLLLVGALTAIGVFYVPEVTTDKTKNKQNKNQP